MAKYVYGEKVLDCDQSNFELFSASELSTVIGVNMCSIHSVLTGSLSAKKYDKFGNIKTPAKGQACYYSAKDIINSINNIGRYKQGRAIVPVIEFFKNCKKEDGIISEYPHHELLEYLRANQFLNNDSSSITIPDTDSADIVVKISTDYPFDKVIGTMPSVVSCVNGDIEVNYYINGQHFDGNSKESFCTESKIMCDAVYNAVKQEDEWKEWLRLFRHKKPVMGNWLSLGKCEYVDFLECLVVKFDKIHDFQAQELSQKENIDYITRDLREFFRIADLEIKIERDILLVAEEREKERKSHIGKTLVVPKESALDIIKAFHLVGQHELAKQVIRSFLIEDGKKLRFDFNSDEDSEKILENNRILSKFAFLGIYNSYHHISLNFREGSPMFMCCNWGGAHMVHDNASWTGFSTTDIIYEIFCICGA